MSNKISIFRMSTRNNRPKDQSFNDSRMFQRQDSDKSVFTYDNPSRTQQLLWQTLTPEMRAEALKRVQLIHMLRQVNPDLQLCRRNTNDASVQVTVTADKGVQVPDVRLEFLNNRRQQQTNNTTFQPKKWSSFIAPGVRINPKSTENPNQTFTQDYTSRSQSRGREQQRRPLKPLQNQTVYNLPKRPSKRIEIKSPDDVAKKNEEKIDKKETKIETEPAVNDDKVELSKDCTKEKEIKKFDDRNENLEITISTVTTNENEPTKETVQKTERQVLIKPKEASSGEEDSVVVVLNQPRTEQGLERKYGQFFCRRCIRGWSSRSVWCVRHTCKVYIKQTCNICNKLVNPYLVCRLPPSSTSNTSKTESPPEVTKVKND